MPYLGVPLDTGANQEDRQAGGVDIVDTNQDGDDNSYMLEGRHFQGARAAFCPKCTRNVGNLRRAECSCTCRVPGNAGLHGVAGAVCVQGSRARLETCAGRVLYLQGARKRLDPPPSSERGLTICTGPFFVSLQAVRV